jgi:hopanoid biosynthesis associated RND transporter like protein HpnN
MTFSALLVGLVDFCRRNAPSVVLAGVLLVIFSGWYAAGHLGITTETDEMFAASLPWRQRAEMFKKLFPQFQDLLAAVIDAREPEEADATAAALAKALAGDREHFLSVRRPDASPFLEREGLLYLDTAQLESLIERMIDAQPFLGELAKDPSARGLFDALSLLGTGVEQGQVNLAPYRTALAGFHEAMTSALAGHPYPLSWVRLLGGELADLGGRYKFVLVQPKLDHTTLEPGGAATKAIREAASDLEFVKSGDARVRITGSVALADEEFASVAQGAATGLIGSILLIALWLFLAVHSWRLIAPILMTLGIGLMLTLLFAAAAVGTLNLVSVGFGILFVGIAVDFAIQFSVRYREMRLMFPEAARALTETGRRVGGQILVASAATAAGFLAFVPTDFRGVAELGLIAGVGMLIAFLCTMTFLPAAISLFRPHGETAEVGFHWARPLDDAVRRRRTPLLAVFAILGLLGLILLPRIGFDADPLHTKNPNTEAMQTLYDLGDSPLTNPFTIDILAADPTAAAGLAERLKKLPLASGVLSINTFVPQDQEAKLALIADAATLMGPSLTPYDTPEPPTVGEIRKAAQSAHDKIAPALAKLPNDQVLAAIDQDLAKLAAAPDAVVIAADRALTRFLPTELDQLRNSLQAQAVALRTSPRSGPAEAGGGQHEGARRLCGGSDRGRARCRRLGRHDRSDQRNDCRRLSFRGDLRGDIDRDHPVHSVAALARHVPGAGAALAFVADDRRRHCPDRVAAELRQHHRAAAAARCRRLLQHLFCDELAGGSDLGAGIGDSAGDPVLGIDDRHRVRVAGAVGASGDGEHGGPADDQPRLHVGREPCLHPSTARCGAEAASPPALSLS